MEGVHCGPFLLLLLYVGSTCRSAKKGTGQYTHGQSLFAAIDEFCRMRASQAL